MAKLIECPACKNKVSIEATACPKCGQPITDAIRDESIKKEKGGKQAVKGCLWIVLALFLFSAAVNLITGGGEDKSEKAAQSAPVAATPAPTPAQPAPEPEKAKPQPVEQKGQEPKQQPAENVKKVEPAFDLTVKKFASNYDKAAKATDSRQRVKIDKKDGNTVQLSMTKNNGAVVTTNDKGKITTIIYIGTGDGTVQSGTDIILGMAFAIAGVKPEWPTEKRGEVMRKLGLLSGDGGLPKSSEAVVGGVKFSFSYSQTTGVFFMIMPEK